MKIRKAVILMMTLDLCFMGILFLFHKEPDQSTLSTDATVKKVALTFDDGPHEYLTEVLLDGLKEREVRATFFITGLNAEKNPKVLKRISEEGHLIGNHTYSHLQLTKRNETAFKQELVKTNHIIKEITGEEVLFVRPPYGTWNKSFEKELNMLPFLWNVDPLDWCHCDTDYIVRKVLGKIRKDKKKEMEQDYVILLHDQYETSVEAAFIIIDE